MRDDYLQGDPESKADHLLLSCAGLRAPPVRGSSLRPPLSCAPALPASPHAPMAPIGSGGARSLSARPVHDT